MRHRVREFKVGRKPAHVRAMLANQVSSLILEGRIRTTVTKAKETRRLAEKMITLGKKGTLHDRRRAISKIGNKEAVKALFAEVAPKFMDRAGGYTRIIRLGFRRGDAAEMCYLELVQESVGKKATKAKAEPKSEEKAPEAAEVVEAAAVEEASTEEAETEAVAEETEAAAEEETSTEEAETEAVAEEDTSEDSAEEAKEEKA